jgi:hypothetical protein
MFIRSVRGGGKRWVKIGQNKLFGGKKNLKEKWKKGDGKMLRGKRMYLSSQYLTTTEFIN